MALVGRIKAAAARVNAELGLLDAGQGGAHRRSGRPDRGRRARRSVPDRRLPDRLGHVFEHERQRGDRGARRVSGRPPERRREHGPIVERRFPLGRPSRGLDEIVHELCPRSTTLAASLRRRRRVRRRRQVRPYAPDGRRPGDAWTGARAATRHKCARGSRGSGRCPRLGQIPLGGTAVGTGLNTHPEFAARVRELLLGRHRAHDLGSGRPRSRRRPRATGSSRPPARCKTLAVSLRRSPTTCG